MNDNPEQFSKKIKKSIEQGKVISIKKITEKKS